MGLSVLNENDNLFILFEGFWVFILRVERTFIFVNRTFELQYILELLAFVSALYNTMH